MFEGTGNVRIHLDFAGVSTRAQGSVTLTGMELSELSEPPQPGEEKVKPSALTLSKIKDVEKRLKETDRALLQLRREERRVSELRRVTLLTLADEHGYPVKVLAEMLDTSEARVRQLLIDTRKELGFPTRPQRGGIPKGARRRTASTS